MPTAMPYVVQYMLHEAQADCTPPAAHACDSSSATPSSATSTSLTCVGTRAVRMPVCMCVCACARFVRTPSETNSCLALGSCSAFHRTSPKTLSLPLRAPSRAVECDSQIDSLRCDAMRCDAIRTSARKQCLAAQPSQGRHWSGRHTLLGALHLRRMLHDVCCTPP
jgi:hypothetical protein